MGLGKERGVTMAMDGSGVTARGGEGTVRLGLERLGRELICETSS
jgi:hypothetical protein